MKKRDHKKPASISLPKVLAENDRSFKNNLLFTQKDPLLDFQE